MNVEKVVTTDWQQSPGWQSQVDDRDTGSDVVELLRPHNNGKDLDRKMSRLRPSNVYRKMYYEQETESM